MPMSTREVATPGNRPGLFLHDRGKTAKQPDFYDSYFPLRFIEVPKCEYRHMFKSDMRVADNGLNSGSYL